MNYGIYDLDGLYRLGLDSAPVTVGRWLFDLPSDLCLAPPHKHLCPVQVMVALVPESRLFVELPHPVWVVPRPTRLPEMRIVVTDLGLLGPGLGYGDSCPSGHGKVPHSTVDEPREPCDEGPGRFGDDCAGLREAIAVVSLMRLWPRIATGGRILSGWRHRLSQDEADVLVLAVAERLVEWAPSGDACGVEGCRGDCGAELRPSTRGAELLSRMDDEHGPIE